MVKDEKAYDDALTFALQNVMGRSKCTLLEAMLGLHWALAKKLFMNGKQAGLEQAMADMENLEVTGPPEDSTPKGLKRPPARDKRPKKKGKG